MLAGVCAAHPDRAASFTCARCGDNGCDECARRVVPTAAPLCASCWRLREQRVETLAKDDGSALCWAAFGLGFLALVPLVWPAQLGAVLLAFFGLRRSRPGMRARPFAWIGGALGLVGAMGTMIALGALVAMS